MKGLSVVGTVFVKYNMTAAIAIITASVMSLFFRVTLFSGNSFSFMSFSALK